MISEKELIYSELSKLYKTYNVEASDDVPANYLVYHLDEMQAYFQRNDYTLTVNCIVKVNEESAGADDLDEMVEAVKAAFYFKSFTTDEITYTFYYDSTDEVEEADKLIRRKDVRFTVVGYEERF